MSLPNAPATDQGIKEPKYVRYCWGCRPISKNKPEICE